jgi:hypothetical protein
MSLYISSRRHFLNRFEPHDEGYLYSTVAGTRGVHVSADERCQIIVDYDRTILPAPFVVFLGFLAGVALVVACALASVPEPWRYASFFVGYLGLPVLYGWSTDPMRKPPFRGRPRVASSLSRSEARARSMDDTSWSTIVLWLFITASQVRWAMTQREPGVIGYYVWTALTVLAAVLWIWFAIGKVRDVWRRRSAERC